MPGVRAVCNGAIEASSLLEPPARLERATWWVEATRSIQLSYGGWTHPGTFTGDASEPQG
jgi:hypothetical protein